MLKGACKGDIIDKTLELVQLKHSELNLISKLMSSKKKLLANKIKEKICG